MSELTITGFTLANYHRPGTVAHLRIWFDRDFVTAEEVFVMGGAIRSGRFYLDMTCSVNATTHVLTIPSFTLPTTNDSSVRNARASGLLFDAGGAFVDYLFRNWIVPEQLAPTSTIAALNAYNSTSNRPPAPGYPTEDQILTLIQEGQQSATIDGTLSINNVPRATAAKELSDSAITCDDDNNVGIATENYFQAGDFQSPFVGSGSRIEINDTFGLAKLFGGADGGNEYAGIWGQCGAASAEVYVQTTGRSHLYGTQRQTFLGDGQFDFNGTTVRIYDDEQMVSQAARNQAPTDDKLFVEEVCFYLDENSNELKARIRLADGSYATWSGTYTPD